MILVLGSGESGVGSALLAKSKGLSVFVSDSSLIEKNYKELLLKNDIQFEENGHEQANKLNVDYVIKSPGIPNTAAIIKQLIHKQIQIISEIEFASKFSNSFKICITGTNGKSTSKQITFNLLNQTGTCHKTLGNKNNQIGVPFSLLTLKETCEFSVMEMGTSEPGEIKILNDQVKPDIAAITNVSMGHLDGLRDTKSISVEKGNILDFHSNNGIAILPRDSEYFDIWNKQTNAKTKISFGYHKESDFRVSNIEIDILNNLTNFVLHFDGQTKDLSMNGIGHHNPLNAALSLATVVNCGINIDTIKHNLRFTDLPERRLAVSESLNGSVLVDDSYNSNPASLKNALDSV